MERAGKASVGALVLGGDVAALGIVRSLGRHNIPVWVVDRQSIAGLSRYCSHRISGWPDAEEAQQIEFLLQIGRQHRLDGWVLFTTGDERSALLARHRDLLNSQYRVAVSDWETMRWGYDKRLTYQLANNLGLSYPSTHYPTESERLRTLDCEFPVILKPAFKRDFNKFTKAKAWLARDRDELLRRYDEAVKLVDPSIIMVQELISGGGENQFSYAGLFEGGRPLASVVAQRIRQYPVDFGRTSTFVETVQSTEMEEAAKLFLGHLRYSGIAEIEFKRDPRNGYKLLDFNPRFWWWHSLAGRAGVDFPYLLWRRILNEPIEQHRAHTGVKWVHLIYDLPAAAFEIRRGHLTVGRYLRSLIQTSAFAVLAKDDLLPALLEIPLKLLSRSRAGFHTGQRSIPKFTPPA